MSVKLNITNDDLGSSLKETVSSFNNVQSGLDVILEFEIKTSDFNMVKDKLLEGTSPSGEFFDFSKDNLNLEYHFVSNIVNLELSGNYDKLYGKIFAINNDVAKSVWDTIHSLSSAKADIEVCLTNIASSNGKIVNIVKILEKNSLEYVSDKYYPYINIPALFEQFFTGKENILLLTGNPGLGKSKLATLALKFALEHPELSPYAKDRNSDPYINVIAVKGLAALSSEEFWLDLEADSPDFVIIDDLDNMLTSREVESVTQEDSDKNKFLNQFLSYTDGLERRFTKFIITTNQKYKSIDSAILRDGRLFDILEMRELTQDEGSSIWESEGLSVDDYLLNAKPGKITSATLGSLIYKYKDSRNKSQESYLNEMSISKLEEAQRKKKIAI